MEDDHTRISALPSDRDETDLAVRADADFDYHPRDSISRGSSMESSDVEVVAEYHEEDSMDLEVPADAGSPAGDWTYDFVGRGPWVRSSSPELEDQTYLTEFPQLEFDSVKTLLKKLDQVLEEVSEPCGQRRSILPMQCPPSWDEISHKLELPLKGTVPFLENYDIPSSEVNVDFDVRKYLTTKIAIAVEKRIIFECQRRPAGFLPPGIGKSNLFRLHYNLLRVYGANFAPALIEISAMSTTRKPMSDFEQISTGRMIFVGAAAQLTSPDALVTPATTRALLHFAPPRPSEGLESITNYWQLIAEEKLSYFCGDSSLLPRERTYFVQRGWTNFGLFNLQWCEMEPNPVRSVLGQDLDATILRVKDHLSSSSLSYDIIELTRHMDVVLESIDEIFRGLPIRDCLLPQLFRWTSLRHEFLRRCKNFEKITVRNKQRMWSGPILPSQ